MAIKKIGKIKLHIPDDSSYKKAISFTAHIIVRYDGGHCGGIDPHILGICKYQTEEEGLMPLLIIVSRSKEVINDYADKGIAYVDCTVCQNNFETARQVKNLLNHINISIVHSHGYSTNYFLYMLKKIDSSGFGKMKTVTTYHGWVEFNTNKKWLTFLDFRTYSMANALICVSESGTRRIEKYKSKKIVRTIRNGIEVNSPEFSKEEISQFLKGYDIKRGKKIICYVGRMDQEKRPDRFIDFAIQLLKKRSDVHFLMAGTGSLLETLKKQIKETNYSSHITFTGEIFPATIVYYVSSLLYLSSDTEGIPMCVLESMSLGTPVIASNVGGLGEIIDNGIDGYILEKNNLKDIVLCADKLLSDTIKLNILERNAVKKINEKFSAKRMQRETMEVYKQLLENN